MSYTAQQPTLDSITSVIFPTSPANLNIHRTPKDAQFLTYTVSDYLVLSAWMPHGFSEFNQTVTQSNDQFYHETCEGCERNCESYLDPYWDSDHEELSEDIPGGFHCWVYDEGYHGQRCPEGYMKGTHSLKFPISNMVFQIFLSHLGEERFSYQMDSAFLAKGRVIEDEETGEKQVLSSVRYQAANVFGNDTHPERICWGSNPRPRTLQGIVEGYGTSNFNSDILPISEFEENCRALEGRDSGILKPEYQYLCEGVDALALLDVEKDLQAFFTFLIAGYKSLPELPHLMIVPMNLGEIEINGSVYSGYKTIPDAVGRQWFITHDGRLLGQV